MKLGNLKDEKAKLMKRAEEVKETTAEKAAAVKTAAGDKTDALVSALDETLLNVKALGLTLKDYEMKSGVVPSLRATLCGSVNAVDEARLEKVIGEHPDNQVLATTLRLLQKAVRHKDRLAVFDLEGIELGIKVGFPPNVSVRFV